MVQQQKNSETPQKPALRQELETEIGQAKKRLELKISQAQAVLLWEQLWPKIAVMLSIIAGFLILTLYGFWSVIPSFLHKLAVLAFLIGLVWSVVQIIRTFVMPRREAALRRLEKAGNLPHRPASSFEDNLSDLPSDDPSVSSKLWLTHRLRMVKMFSRLKSGWPKASLERFDPYALRGLAVLMLLFGFVIHGDKSWEQIKKGLSFSSPIKEADIRIDAWLTPPVFTGKNPIMLSDATKAMKPAASEKDGEAQPKKQFEVLENSELVVRIIGKEAGRYSVRYRTDENTAKLLPFDVDKKQENQSQSALEKLSYRLKETATIEILQGKKLVRSWSVHVLKDLKPAIFLTKNPEKTKRSAMLLTYQIADDFGVTQAQAKILKVLRSQPSKKDGSVKGSAGNVPDLVGKDGDDGKMKPLGKPVAFDLKLPVASLKEGEAKTYKDLTAHPWAGLPVQLQLEVRDQAGNIGRSEVLALKLPQRKFTKPVAQALIELRRFLVLNPSEYSLVSKGLDVLSREAEKHKIDKTAYLSLRDIYWNIRHMSKKRFLVNLRRIRGEKIQSPQNKRASTRDRVRGLVDQMWETALRIEDGNLSKAERDLRRAQDKLADAISRNASPEEIEKLMKELRQALGKYMQARRQQQKKQNAENMQPQQGQGKQQQLTSGDLNEMLKRIEQMAKTGSKDAAQQMLNRLRDMLESLQSPQQQSAGSAQSKKMMELMNKFSDLAQKQQKLQEKTFQENRKNMKPQGQNNRFSRFNNERFRRQFNRNGQRRPGNRFRQTQPQNPYYRRGNQGRQGQQGQRGRGPGKRGRNDQGLRSQDSAGRGNLGRPGLKGGEGRFTQGKGEQLAREQRGLQKQLDNLMNELGRMGGALPRELGKARQQMGQAGKKLGENQLGNATKQQGKALDSLRKGAKKMAEEMMKKMNRQYSRNGRDPLGRQRGNSGFDPGMDVKVPDEIDTQRAREILEELRRRLGEVERSPAELDYLESLIKRF